MSNELRIHAVTNADLNPFSELCSETFVDTYEGKGVHRPPEMAREYAASTFSPESLKKELADPSVQTYVASLNGALVGYFKLINEAPPEFVQPKDLSHLERFYVLKKYHRKGIGKELLQFAERVLINEGKKGVWLGVWDENEQAISFYLSQGFQKVGSKKWEFSYADTHYVDTDVVMVKCFHRSPKNLV